MKINKKLVALLGVTILIGSTSVSALKLVSEKSLSEEDHLISVSAINDILEEGIEIGEIITQGKIIAFDGEAIHLLTGDIASIYPYDNSQESDFYLGQEVVLIKGEEKDKIELVERYTTNQTLYLQGMPLHLYSGAIKEIDGEQIVLATEEGDVVLTGAINFYETQIGKSMKFYTVNFGEQPIIVHTLDEEAKLDLTISHMTRGEDGSMLIKAIDKAGEPYTFNRSNVASDTSINLTSVGDEITVYHKGMSRSYPMQVIPVFIEGNKQLEVIDQNTIEDEAVQSKIEEMKKEQGGYAFMMGDRQYIVVFGGEVPTGGYHVEISDITKKKDVYEVNAQLVPPAADSMTTQAIDYPYTVVAMPMGITLDHLIFNVDNPIISH